IGATSTTLNLMFFAGASSSGVSAFVKVNSCTSESPLRSTRNLTGRKPPCGDLSSATVPSVRVADGTLEAVSKRCAVREDRRVAVRVTPASVRAARIPGAIRKSSIETGGTIGLLPEMAYYGEHE